MSYWHVREEALNPGDQVAPGRWGSIVLSRGGYTSVRQNGHVLFFRELLFEQIRRSVAPDAPSRLTCAYAWESQPFAEQQAREMNQHAHEVTAGNAPVSRHDAWWVTWVLQPNLPIDTYLEGVTRYWRGESCSSQYPGTPQNWEILVGGPLHVTRRTV